jgi:hypothetical protein
VRWICGRVFFSSLIYLNSEGVWNFTTSLLWVIGSEVFVRVWLTKKISCCFSSAPMSLYLRLRCVLMFITSSNFYSFNPHITSGEGKCCIWSTRQLSYGKISTYWVRNSIKIRRRGWRKNSSSEHLKLQGAVITIKSFLCYQYCYQSMFKKSIEAKTNKNNFSKKSS